MYVMLQNRKIK